jgi:hypothetical protein
MREGCRALFLPARSEGPSWLALAAISIAFHTRIARSACSRLQVNDYNGLAVRRRYIRFPSPAPLSCQCWPMPANLRLRRVYVVSSQSLPSMGRGFTRSSVRDLLRKLSPLIAWHYALHELIKHGNCKCGVAMIGTPHHTLRDERAARRCK